MSFFFFFQFSDVIITLLLFISQRPVNPVQNPYFFGEFFQIKKLKAFLGVGAQGKKNLILTKEKYLILTS